MPRGRGIVVNEPSAVALDDSTGEVQVVGREARKVDLFLDMYFLDAVVRTLLQSVVTD